MPIGELLPNTNFDSTHNIFVYNGTWIFDTQIKRGGKNKSIRTITSDTKSNHLACFRTRDLNDVQLIIQNKRYKASLWTKDGTAKVLDSAGGVRVITTSSVETLCTLNRIKTEDGWQYWEGIFDATSSNTLHSIMVFFDGTASFYGNFSEPSLVEITTQDYVDELLKTKVGVGFTEKIYIYDKNGEKVDFTDKNEVLGVNRVIGVDEIETVIEKGFNQFYNKTSDIEVRNNDRFFDKPFPQAVNLIRTANCDILTDVYGYRFIGTLDTNVKRGNKKSSIKFVCSDNTSYDVITFIYLKNIDGTQCIEYNKRYKIGIWTKNGTAVLRKTNTSVIDIIKADSTKKLLTLPYVKTEDSWDYWESEFDMTSSGDTTYTVRFNPDATSTDYFNVGEINLIESSQVKPLKSVNDNFANFLIDTNKVFNIFKKPGSFGNNLLNNRYTLLEVGSYIHIFGYSYYQKLATLLLSNIKTNLTDVAVITTDGLVKIADTTIADTIYDASKNWYQFRPYTFIIKEVLKKAYGIYDANTYSIKLPDGFIIPKFLDLTVTLDSPSYSIIGRPPTQTDEDNDGDPDNFPITSKICRALAFWERYNRVYLGVDNELWELNVSTMIFNKKNTLPTENVIEYLQIETDGTYDYLFLKTRIRAADDSNIHEILTSATKKDSDLKIKKVAVYIKKLDNVINYDCTSIGALNNVFEYDSEFNYYSTINHQVYYIYANLTSDSYLNQFKSKYFSIIEGSLGGCVDLVSNDFRYLLEKFNVYQDTINNNSDNLQFDYCKGRREALRLSGEKLTRKDWIINDYFSINKVGKESFDFTCDSSFKSLNLPIPFAQAIYLNGALTNSQPSADWISFLQNYSFNIFLGKSTQLKTKINLIEEKVINQNIKLRENVFNISKGYWGFYIQKNIDRWMGNLWQTPGNNDSYWISSDEKPSYLTPDSFDLDYIKFSLGQQGINKVLKYGNSIYYIKCELKTLFNNIKLLRNNIGKKWVSEAPVNYDKNIQNNPTWENNVLHPIDGKLKYKNINYSNLKINKINLSNSTISEVFEIPILHYLGRELQPLCIFNDNTSNYFYLSACIFENIDSVMYFNDNIGEIDGLKFKGIKYVKNLILKIPLDSIGFGTLNLNSDSLNDKSFRTNNYKNPDFKGSNYLDCKNKFLQLNNTSAQKFTVFITDSTQDSTTVILNPNFISIQSNVGDFTSSNSAYSILDILNGNYLNQNAYIETTKLNKAIPLLDSLNYVNPYINDAFITPDFLYNDAYLIEDFASNKIYVGLYHNSIINEYGVAFSGQGKVIEPGWIYFLLDSNYNDPILPGSCNLNAVIESTVSNWYDLQIELQEFKKVAGSWSWTTVYNYSNTLAPLNVSCVFDGTSFVDGRFLRIKVASYWLGDIQEAREYYTDELNIKIRRLTLEVPIAGGIKVLKVCGLSEQNYTIIIGGNYNYPQSYLWRPLDYLGNYMDDFNIEKEYLYINVEDYLEETETFTFISTIPKTEDTDTTSRYVSFKLKPFDVNSCDLTQKMTLYLKLRQGHFSGSVGTASNIRVSLYEGDVLKQSNIINLGTSDYSNFDIRTITTDFTSSNLNTENMRIRINPIDSKQVDIYSLYLRITNKYYTPWGILNDRIKVNWNEGSGIGSTTYVSTKDNTSGYSTQSDMRLHINSLDLDCTACDTMLLYINAQSNLALDSTRSPDLFVILSHYDGTNYVTISDTTVYITKIRNIDGLYERKFPGLSNLNLNQLYLLIGAKTYCKGDSLRLGTLRVGFKTPSNKEVTREIRLQLSNVSSTPDKLKLSLALAGVGIGYHFPLPKIFGYLEQKVGTTYYSRGTINLNCYYLTYEYENNYAFYESSINLTSSVNDATSYYLRLKTSVNIPQHSIKIFSIDCKLYATCTLQSSFKYKLYNLYKGSTDAINPIFNILPTGNFKNTNAYISMEKSAEYKDIAILEGAYYNNYFYVAVLLLENIVNPKTDTDFTCPFQYSIFKISLSNPQNYTELLPLEYQPKSLTIKDGKLYFTLEDNGTIGELNLSTLQYRNYDAGYAPVLDELNSMSNTIVLDSTNPNTMVVSSPKGKDRYSFKFVSGKYYLTQLHKKYYPILELADFEGMNCEDVLIKLCEGINWVKGFDEDGNFFMVNRKPIYTEPDLILKEGIDVKNINLYDKENTVNDIYNKQTITPYTTKLGGITNNIILKNRVDGKNELNLSIDIQQRDLTKKNINLICVRTGAVALENEDSSSCALFKWKIYERETEIKVANTLVAGQTVLYLYSVFGGEDSDGGIKKGNVIKFLNATTNEYEFCEITNVNNDNNSVILALSGFSFTINKDTVGYVINYRNVYQSNERVAVCTGLAPDYTSYNRFYVNSLENIGIGNVLENIRNIQTIVKDKKIIPDGTTLYGKYLVEVSTPNFVNIGEIIKGYWTPLVSNVGYEVGGSSIYIKMAIKDRAMISKVETRTFLASDYIQIICEGLRLEADETGKQTYVDVNSIASYGLIEGGNVDNKFLNRILARNLAKTLIMENAKPRYILSVDSIFLPMLKFISKKDKRLFVVRIQNSKLFPLSMDNSEDFYITNIRHQVKRRRTSFSVRGVKAIGEVK